MKLGEGRKNYLNPTDCSVYDFYVVVNPTDGRGNPDKLPEATQTP